VANVNSDQYAKWVSVPVQHVKPNEWGGRVRSMFFNVAAVPTGAGDTMTLGVLPKGARVVGGYAIFSAAQTGTTAIGIAGTTGKYHAATVISNVVALTCFIAALTADNLGAETTAAEVIQALNAGAVWVAGSFAGRIDYIVD
jgi:hypothetical protein